VTLSSEGILSALQLTPLDPTSSIMIDLGPLPVDPLPVGVDGNGRFILNERFADWVDDSGFSSGQIKCVAVNRDTGFTQELGGFSLWNLTVQD